MEITITRKKNKNLLEKSRLVWKILYKKQYLFIIIFAIIGLIAIGTGILSIKKTYILNGKEYKYLFWNPMTCLGVSLILFSILSFNQFYKNKRAFFANIKRELIRLSNHTIDEVIKFNEDSVSYDDTEITSQIKWSAFESHKLYKNHLLILTGNPLINSIIIVSREEMTSTNFDELYKFISKKLPKKV